MSVEAMESAARRGEPSDRKLVIASIVIATIATIIYLLLAIKLFAIRALDQYNIFFDADPSTRLAMIAHGWPGNDDLIHPNLSNLFSIPIRVLGFAVDRAGLFPDQQAAREAIGLSVVPLAVGLSVFLFGRTLAFLPIRPVVAIIALVAYAFSMTALIFGALPESFGLSLLVISASFCLLARIVQKGDVSSGVSFGLFTLFIFLSGSITVTNMAIVGLLGLVAESIRTDSIVTAFKRMILAGTIGVLGIVTVAMVFTFVRGSELYKKMTVDEAARWTQMWIAPNWLENAAVRMPSAFADSLTPRSMHSQPSPNEPISLKFSMEPPSPPNYLGMGILAVLLWSGCRAMIRDPALRPVLGSALAILVYNWVFHAFWGSDRVLYSAHWLTALMIVLAVGLNAGAQRRWVVPLAGIVVVAIIASNVSALSSMIAIITTISRDGPWGPVHF